MAQTYKITDGVRRAKAASLAGHQTIWARVGQSQREEKMPIRSLCSPQKEIDVRQTSELERWMQVKRGMSQEPDLFPPIDVVPGSAGTPIEEVQIVGAPA
jgi:hypothetical protein